MSALARLSRAARPVTSSAGGAKAAMAAIAVIAAIGALPVAHAAEGAGGRPVAGTGVQPSAGIVPPQPAWLGNLSVLQSSGDIGTERQVPIAGRVSLGAESTFTLVNLTLTRAWGSGPGGWSFMSGVTVPWMRTEVGASVEPPLFPRVSQQTSGLYDLTLTPVVAGLHLSPTEHLAFGLRVVTPSGRYVEGRLANVSQNVWNLVPSIAYTRLLPEQSVELSAVGAVFFSTRNKATNYRSAPLATLDVLVTRRLGHGVALGGVLGIIEQIGDDSGALADRLNGFQGRELAIGPTLVWTTTLGGAPLTASLRWMATVYARDRFDRDTLMLTATMPF
jgi:hypothetical protein